MGQHGENSNDDEEKQQKTTHITCIQGDSINVQHSDMSVRDFSACVIRIIETLGVLNTFPRQMATTIAAGTKGAITPQAPWT